MASSNSLLLGLTACAGSLHAIIYFCLLSIFTRSLWPDRSPVITRLALLIRGEMPPVLYDYTRRVTIAWAVFCAAQLLISLLLFLFAPATWWLVFISLLNMPLVVLMLMGEYTYRRWRFPQFSHESWQDIRRMPARLRKLLLTTK